MFFDSKPFTLDRVVRVAIAVALAWGLVWVLGYLSDVLIPFAAALILAYLMNPLVGRIQKRVRNRVAAVLISLLLVLMVFSVLTWLLVPLVVAEFRQMGRILSDFVHNTEIAERASKRFPPNLWQTVKDYAASEAVQDFFKTGNFLSVLETAARRVLPGVWGLITGTASFVMGVVGLAVIALYLVFLLVDYQRLRRQWKEMLPPAYRISIEAFVGDFSSAMNRYFRAQAAVAAIVGGLHALGFWLIHLPMGIMLGLLTGLLNMVPYLQILAVIPAFFLAVVYSVETGVSVWLMLALTALVFVVVEVIQQVVLVPRILGRSTGLSPALILLSLSIWGKLLGVLGLLIALPMTCILLAYYRRFIGSGRPTRAAGSKD